MADLWKIEYHVIGVDDEAFAWFDDDQEQALAYAKQEGGIRVDAVRYYHNNTETVWETTPETPEGETP